LPKEVLGVTCQQEREREREGEREKFIDNQIDDWRSVSTTPLQGDRETERERQRERERFIDNQIDDWRSERERQIERERERERERDAADTAREYSEVHSLKTTRSSKRTYSSKSLAPMHKEKLSLPRGGGGGGGVCGAPAPGKPRALCFRYLRKNSSSSFFFLLIVLLIFLAGLLLLSLSSSCEGSPDTNSRSQHSSISTV
jgi:hypothetical protein